MCCRMDIWTNKMDSSKGDAGITRKGGLHCLFKFGKMHKELKKDFKTQNVFF